MLILFILFVLSIFFPVMWFAFFGYLVFSLLPPSRNKCIRVMRDAISKLIASGQSEADFKGIPYTLAQMYALDCGAELAYMTKTTDPQNDIMGFSVSTPIKKYYVSISRLNNASTCISIRDYDDPSHPVNQYMKQIHEMVNVGKKSPAND